MKLLKYIFIVPILAFISCSSDEPNDGDVVNGERATRYTASFLVLENSNSVVEDSSIESLWNVVNTIVPYSTDESEKVIQIGKIDHYDITYTLLLANKSAKLDIDTVTYKNEISNVYKVITYTYEIGRYYITEYEDDRWSMVVDVTNDAIYMGYLIKETEEKTDSYHKIVDLFNCSIEKTELISSTKGEQKSEETSYSGLFNVVLEPTGLVTLRNLDYLFNFHPSIGVLTMLEPDYEEIGVLDRQ